jgi:Arc/MetJ-type ribon-helix-helix transcriptional regulator
VTLNMLLRMQWKGYNFFRMEITLPAELAAYVDKRVREGASVSATEFIQEAIRRKMESDAWMEEKMIEAEQSELSALTGEDLDSVRRLIRQPRATRTS